ncbi:UNVERIFIED_CONTAM: BREX-1 system adenine-specific DNA-methyltransferase PglX [Halobacillus marinus]
MNKSALRSFAISARRELIDKVKTKAMKFGITEEKIKQADVESSDAVIIDGKQLSSEEKTQRENLIKRIKLKGFNQVMEEVAYTWFNRFTALRFMEVNEYLPTNVRVLSSLNPNDPTPDIIKEAMSLDLDIDKKWVYEKKVKNENEKLYQYLIIKQCNELYEYMPFMFERINDYTELLFPDGLLSKKSFLTQIVNIKTVPENEWNNVEIIGWLYQYYIAEEKDRVIQAKEKYKTEEIPFATQLFTPNWIVRYMVQNSLGRYWVENHPEDNEIVREWDYYLENNNDSENGFEEQAASYKHQDLKIEDIKCFDPAMGSGHILIYMFDVLYEIYSRSGYIKKDIPRLIIENNLYGLDIDERAYQLACFSLVMKALEYDKRFIRKIRRNPLQLNLTSITETNTLDETDIRFLADKEQGYNHQNITEFIEQFSDAKTIGSLRVIKDSEIDISYIIERMHYIQNNPSENIFEEESRQKILEILPSLIKQYTIMTTEYDILVTNPPYMGSRYMNDVLTKYINSVYPESKADTFSAFIEYAIKKVKPNGHIGLLTPYVWMFISSYEKLRNYVLKNTTISSLIQLEYNSFPEATVPVCTFTLRNACLEESGQYIRLTDFIGSDIQPIKTLEAINNPSAYYRYSSVSANYNKIPGSPIAYWLSEDMIDSFNKGVSIDTFSEFTGSQNITANNKKYLRKWWEVNLSNVGEDNKWVFYAKGGSFRKHYGNLETVVDWDEEARNYYKSNKSSNLLNEKYWYKEGVTYTDITTTRGSTFRYLPKGCVFDKAGPSINNLDNLYYTLAFLNTKIVDRYLQVLNPTMHIQVKDVKNLPIIIDTTYKETVEKIEVENVKLSKEDWDNFEVSYDFSIHPFLKKDIKKDLISETHEKWKEITEANFMKLKKNEEEVNRLFIDIYNLSKDITPQINDHDVTIRKSDLEKDIKSFVSYAVGCIFGRYSFEQEGIVTAGEEFDISKYGIYKADNDNIIPILSGAYFEDDIVSRFVDFVKVTFGEETLNQNIDFVAESLGKKKNETSKETIRRYFLNDFFKDHTQTFKKRPIYWQFTSGKQKAFNCLIYMHRYDPTLLGRIRTDYLHELQIRMDVEKESLINIIEGDSPSKEITQAKKELKSLEKEIEELKEYDEVLHNMADQEIEIDLNDGVEVNYAKFKHLLVKK